MTQPIEIPESKLTDALIEDYMAFRRGPDDHLIWQEHFQKLCGLLIKHGLVSPPVYVLRDTADNLLQTNTDDTLHFCEYDPEPLPDYLKYEHWKGQRNEPN